MQSIDPSSRTCANWRNLYLAAVFETNTNRIPSRIQTAQKAIAERSRELFASRDNNGERSSLDSAVVKLQALGMCVSSRKDIVEEYDAL